MMKAPNPTAGSTAQVAPGAADQAVIPDAPRTQPQLIKQAFLDLSVKSIDETVRQIEAIARTQRGDVTGFINQRPHNSSARHTANLDLRIPADRLDRTLEQLAQLGTVQSQRLTVEDVSSQLVDFKARLRSLRKSEEMLLQIMERSGSVGDVLKVAQELRNIRQTIEQIDAQVQDLQKQVAYSTIRLNLEEALTTTQANYPLGLQMQETWNQATRSMGKLTLNLMRTGVWLLVYSPYLGAIAAVVYGFRRLRRSRTSPPRTTEPSS
jgi:Mg2+ and Co2+ transporter CorA